MFVHKPASRQYLCRSNPIKVYQSVESEVILIMEKVYTLRALSDQLGINYHTIRRWCHLNLIEFSRTPTGIICLSSSQVERMLDKMAKNGNAHAINDDDPTNP